MCIRDRLTEAVNNRATEADRTAAASWLGSHYDGGLLLLDEAAIPASPIVGIPLRQQINRSDGDLFRAALTRPAEHVRWLSLIHIFTVEAQAPTSAIQADNGLSVSVHAVPAGGRCERDLTGIPLSVDIDGGTSSITADPGTGRLTGFARFPQVLGGTLPIAIRGSGPDRDRGLQQAAALVSSLQQANRGALTPRLISPQALLSGGQSGLLIGATGDDSDRVGAPLRLYGMRLLYTRTERLAVGTDAPYGALVAASSGGRDLLLLGGWASQSDQAAPQVNRLAQAVAGQSWACLLYTSRCV